MKKLIYLIVGLLLFTVACDNNDSENTSKTDQYKNKEVTMTDIIYDKNEHVIFTGSVNGGLNVKQVVFTKDGKAKTYNINKTDHTVQELADLSDKELKELVMNYNRKYKVPNSPYLPVNVWNDEEENVMFYDFRGYKDYTSAFDFDTGDNEFGQTDNNDQTKKYFEKAQDFKRHDDKTVDGGGNGEYESGYDYEFNGILKPLNPMEDYSEAISVNKDTYTNDIYSKDDNIYHYIGYDDMDDRTHFVVAKVDKNTTIKAENTDDSRIKQVNAE